MTTQTADRTTDSAGTAESAETMRAIVQADYGSAPENVLRLAEVARPVIGDGDILEPSLLAGESSSSGARPTARFLGGFARQLRAQVVSPFFSQKMKLFGA